MNTTTKNIIKVSIIILLTSLFTWIIWIAISSSVSNFANSINIANSPVSLSEKKLNNMLRELRSSDKYVQKLKKVTISKELVPELLNSIEEQAVGDTAVIIREVSNSDDDGIIRISLILKCSLINCMDTATNIIKLKKLIGLENLNFLEKDNGDWTTSMVITMPILPLDNI